MILKAEIVWAGPGRMVRDGGIRVEEGHIAQVAPFVEMDHRNDSVEDFGNAVLLPTMANAHVHLDLSHLEGKLMQSADFTQWLKQVARARKVTVFEGRSVNKGIDQVIGGGATLVGDISVSGRSAGALRRRGLGRSIVFCEAIGLDPAKADQQAGKLRAKIERLLRKATVRIGISPHAPYSVSPELFRRCVSLAKEYSLPMAIHTAETASEVEFLKRGTGELRQLLENYDLLPKGWRPPGLTPMRHLESLGVLNAQPLLIHCNHVDMAEAETLAKLGCPVAYCPRSNAFFQRDTNSLHLLQSAGVNVAIGTDSLASNSSLSMLDEIIFLKKQHPELRWDTIFQMATQNGAVALGVEQGGILATGLPANITAISLPPPEQQRPAEPLALDEASTVLLTMAHGQPMKPRTERLQELAGTA